MRHVILTIFILFISNNAIASNTCLIGKDFNQEELEKIRIENNQFENELIKLQLLAHQNPNNLELKEKLDKKTSRFDQIIKAQELYAKIQLPQNLQDCSELTIPNDQFRKLMEKWQIIASKYPTNRNVIYNFKLLTKIMMERISG